VAEESSDAGGVDDLITEHLAVLFCGINPGTVSGSTGRHFARKGNRFWKLLFAGGFTDRLLDPVEQGELLELGLGITNLVDRVTAAAKDLSTAELVAGAAALSAKVARFSPVVVAFLGLDAYRKAFSRPGALVGRQSEDLAGSIVWLLPNPSGLQARYQLDEMTALYRELADFVGR
jgi:double-stranded uracil-DNA glycosylase